MNMTERVKIPLSSETRERLKGLGKKGETYDAIIRRLMEKADGE